MRTDLVDGLLARHPEGHDDAAALFLNQLLGRYRQILEAWDGTADGGEAGAVARALLERIERLAAHVVAGEHRVDHPDVVHEPLSRTGRPDADGSPCVTPRPHSASHGRWTHCTLAASPAVDVAVRLAVTLAHAAAAIAHAAAAIAHAPAPAVP